MPRETREKTRREPNGDSSPRRKELLQIAAEVFAEQGYRGTTVRDIADRANMLSGSLFYHFKTKDSIAEELIRPVFDEWLTMTREVVAQKAPVDEKIATLGRRYLTMLVGENLLASRILQNDWHYLVNLFPFLEEGFAEINRLWTKMLKQGVADGVLRDDIEPVIMLHIVRSVSNDLMRWFDPKKSYTIEDIAEAVTAVLLNGIRKRR